MRYEEKIMTFSEWKDKQIALDSKNSNADRSLRPKEWYWAEYGKYCNKERHK